MTVTYEEFKKRVMLGRERQRSLMRQKLNKEAEKNKKELHKHNQPVIR